MQVKVFGRLRSVLGGSEVLDVTVCEGDTVLVALESVMEQRPALRAKVLGDDRSLRAGLSIFLNGRSVRYLEGLGTRVQNSDSLALFPPIAGG